MAGSIQATPRNRLLGLLADGIGGASAWASENNPPVQGLLGLLGVPAVTNTLNEMSYGGALGTGSGMTWRPKADTIDAAMAVAPVVAKAPEAINALAAAAGKRAAPVVESLVNRTMANDGFGAKLLQDLSSGTTSNMIRKSDPNVVWYRGQNGEMAGRSPFDATLRDSPSFADSPEVASEYALNPNAAGNYAAKQSSVTGASVHPYSSSGTVWDLNEFQGGNGTESGITWESLKNLAKEIGLSPSNVRESLLPNMSQKWGKGKNSYWDSSSPEINTKNRVIPAYVVAEDPEIVAAARAKGIDSIQFKGVLSDQSKYDPVIPWDESLLHQELRPLNRESLKSIFERNGQPIGGLLK